jgi:ubiquitin carboxyl-terminal hydrolase 7
MDFVDLSHDDLTNEQLCRKLRVRKDQTYGDFKQGLAADLGLPPTHIRCWFLVNRQNKTIRPDTPIPDDEADNSKCIQL